MPLYMTPKSRRLYERSLNELERAIVDLGEAIRLDGEYDAKAMRIALEEMTDASRRIAQRLRREQR